MRRSRRPESTCGPLHPGRRIALGCWFGLLPLLLLAAPARGQVRLLVLEPQSPFLKAERLADLKQVLLGRADEYPDLEPIAAPGLADLQQRAGCRATTNRCLKQLGLEAGAQQVLFTQVQKLPGRHLLLMRLVDSATGRQLKRARLRTRQGPAALRASLRRGFTRLFGRLIEMHLELAANVEEAEILLDGRVLGKSPLIVDRKLTTGRHVLSALRDDYLPAEHPFAVKAGQRGLRYRFELKLQPAGDDIAPVALVPKPPPIEEPPEADVRNGKLPGDKDELAAGPSGAKLPGDKAEGAAGPGGAKLPGDKDEGAAGPVGAKLPGDKGEVAGPAGAKLPGDKGEVAGPAGAKPADAKGSKLPVDKDATIEPAEVAAAGSASIAGPLLAETAPQPPPETRPFLPAGQPEPEPATERPVYKTWWFWTAVGAVAVAGVVTGTVLGLSGEEGGIPSGQGRMTLHF